MRTEDGSLTWDLWIDFHTRDTDDFTSTLLEYARPGIAVEVGTYLLVGSDDSELAVARIVSVEPNGLVYTRVLPGPASEHLHLLGASSAA
jgi:hypothetical protein